MKEAGIQTAIEQYLQILENQNKLLYQKNNSGGMMTNRFGKNNFIRFGKRGSPDFYVFLPNGITLHLEVKNEKGKQNVNQLEFELKLKQLNHIYKIVRSLDDVENIIKSYIK